MKKLYIIAGILIILSAPTTAQYIYNYNTGGVHANFGVDADTRAGYTKYSSTPGALSTDDWFALTGDQGRGVIDTTNASAFSSLLKANSNISFVQRMAVAPYTKVNGTLWLDAVYARDFIKGANGKDSTAFTDAKNTVSPNNWKCGSVNSMDPNYDIVDAFAHFRRNGSTAKDSLWFFGAISTVGNATDRYADIELDSKVLTYNRTSGNFNTAALQGGHTEWLIDPLGNVIQSGDVLITIIYKTGQRPTVDIHLWISKLTLLSSHPSKFNFGNVFHASTSNSLYGWNVILPKSNNGIVGSGIMNSGATASKDTTYATPWGNAKTNYAWSPNYDSKQIAEIGLNFTRIGIDPSLYLIPGASACDRMFASVLFKTGTTATSGGGGDGGGGGDDNHDHHDGGGGGDDNHDHNHDGGGDDNHNHDGGGDGGGDHGGDHSANNNGNGTIIGGANGANGSENSDCSDNNDWITLKDFVGPIAFVKPALDFTTVFDVVLTCNKPISALGIANASCAGIYKWSTLNGNIVGSNDDSTAIKVNRSGIYNLTATLAPNCPTSRFETAIVNSDSTPPVATADITISPVTGGLQLIGGDTMLSKILTPFGGSQGLLWQWDGPNGYQSHDQNPSISSAWGTYRLTLTEARNGCQAFANMDVSFSKAHTKDAQEVTGTNNYNKSIYISHNPNSNSALLVTNQTVNTSTRIAIFTVLGQLLDTKNVQLSKGHNVIELPLASSSQPRMVCVYNNNKLVFTQKVIF